ncbi:MAG: hypothetical protein Q9220_002608 [cf. Caloplaca sp. 1 TL-2023]
MDPRDTDNAIAWLQSSKPPVYLELFNEPDLSFGGDTPQTLPEQSAKNLTKLIAAKGSAHLISPVPAYTGSDWLKEFNGNCSGCLDSQVEYIGAHVYDVDPAGSISQIQNLHNQWPNKKIWVTELSPATNPGPCQFDPDGMIQYMTTLVNGIKALGYVEKIFWNTGTYGYLSDDPNICNPSLTNRDGSATALLEAYGKLCSA